MLLAVEGGGFFSASASGYSKGLNLLLLGQKDEEKPMRVTPWNHYHTVDQEVDPDLQLAPGKNRIVRGCASFVCFGGAAGGPGSQSPQKVGPTEKQEVLAGPLNLDKDVNGSNGNERKLETLCEKDNVDTSQMERRKVQWNDNNGGELFEVREFEMSEVGSDSEFDHGNGKTCLCTIM